MPSPCQLCLRNPGEVYERTRSQTIDAGVEEQETRIVVHQADRTFTQQFALCDECIGREWRQERRAAMRGPAKVFGISLGIGLLAIPFMLMREGRPSIINVVPIAMAPVAFIALLVLLKALIAPLCEPRVAERFLDRAYETWRREKRCEICGELAKVEVVLCYQLKIHSCGYRCAAHESVDEPFAVAPLN